VGTVDLENPIGTGIISRFQICEPLKESFDFFATQFHVDNQLAFLCVS